MNFKQFCKQTGEKRTNLIRWRNMGILSKKKNPLEYTWEDLAEVRFVSGLRGEGINWRTIKSIIDAIRPEFSKLILEKQSLIYPLTDFSFIKIFMGKLKK